MSNLVIWHTFDLGDVSNNIMYNRAYGAPSFNLPISNVNVLTSTTSVLGTHSFFVNGSTGIQFGGNPIYSNYFPNNAFTMSIWAKLTLTTNMSSLLEIIDLRGNVMAIYTIGMNTIRVRSNGVNADITRATDTKWHHLLLTAIQGKLSFYFDGSLKSVTYNSSGIIPPNSFAGNCYLAYNFSGYVDEMRIYNTALSDDQVYDLYNKYTTFCNYRFEPVDVSSKMLANYASGLPIFDASFVDSSYNLFGSSTYQLATNASATYGKSALYQLPYGQYSPTKVVAISNGTVVNTYSPTGLFNSLVDLAVNTAGTIMIMAHNNCVALSTLYNGTWTPFVPITAFSTTSVYTACAMFPDGSKIVVSGNPLYGGSTNNGTFIATWNGTTYDNLLQTLDTTAKRMVSFGISSDAQTLVAASHYTDGHFYFAKWVNGNFSAYTQTLDTNSAYGTVICTCTVSPDANMLVFSYGDTIAWAAWNGTNYSATSTFITNATEFNPMRMAFSADGKNLFVVGNGVGNNSKVNLECFYFNGSRFETTPFYIQPNSSPTNFNGTSRNVIAIAGGSNTVYTIANYVNTSLLSVISYGITHSYIGQNSAYAKNYIKLPALKNVDASGITMSTWVNCTDMVAQTPLSILSLANTNTLKYNMYYDSFSKGFLFSSSYVSYTNYTTLFTGANNVNERNIACRISAPGNVRLFFSANDSRMLMHSRVVNGVFSTLITTSTTFIPSDPPENYCGGVAITADGKRIVVFYSGFRSTNNAFYFGDSTNIFNGVNNQITLTRIEKGITTVGFLCIAMIPDGSRFVISGVDGYVYLSMWTGTTYSSFTRTLDTTSRPELRGIGMTQDGSRIAYCTENNVYWADWNGTNYGTGTLISGLDNLLGITFAHGYRVIVASKISSPSGAQYVVWNGTEYSAKTIVPISSGNNGWDIASDASNTIYYFPYGSNSIYSFNVANPFLDTTISRFKEAFSPYTTTLFTQIQNSGNQLPNDNLACRISAPGNVRLMVSANNGKMLIHSRVINGVFGTFITTDTTFIPSGPPENYCGGVAITADGKRIVVFYSGYTSTNNAFYFGDSTNIFNGVNNQITLTRIEKGITDVAFTCIAMTPDGSRFVISGFDGYVYLSTWTGTTYSSFTRTLDTTSRGNLRGIGITQDGSRIAYCTNDNVYWADWVGTNYGTGTLITGLNEIKGVTFAHGNKVIVTSKTSSSPSGVKYVVWNGTEYSAASIIPISSGFSGWDIASDASNTIYYFPTGTVSLYVFNVLNKFDDPNAVVYNESFSNYTIPLTSTQQERFTTSISAPGNVRLLVCANDNVGLRYSRIVNGSYGSLTNPSITFSEAIPTNYCTGAAITSNGKRIVVVYGGYSSDTNTFYFGDSTNIFNGVNTQITMTKIEKGITNAAFVGIAITNDGSRFVTASLNTGRVYLSIWTGTTYSSFIQTLDIARGGSLNGIGMTLDGSRIAYCNTGEAYWADWNGTNYGTGTLIPDLKDTRGVTFAYGNKIILAPKNSSPPGVQYVAWNGTDYSSFRVVPSYAIPTAVGTDGWGITSDADGYVYYYPRSNTSLYVFKMSYDPIITTYVPSSTVSFSNYTTPITNAYTNNFCCGISSSGNTQLFVFGQTSTNVGVYYSRITNGTMGAVSQISATYSPDPPAGYTGVYGCAVIGLGTRIVISIGTTSSTYIYWGNSTDIFNGGTSPVAFTRITDTNTNRFYVDMAITPDGNTISTISYNEGIVYFAKWNGFNYGTLTAIANPANIYSNITSICISPDGNRIAYNVDDNTVLWSAWNGTNYGPATSMFGYNGLSIAFAYGANVIITGHSYDTPAAYYIWNGTTYNAPLTVPSTGIPTTTASRCAMAIDDKNVIYYFPSGASNVYKSSITYKTSVLSTTSITTLPAPYSAASSNIGSMSLPNYARFGADCSLNNWHHIAWSVSPTSWKIWIDGSGTTFLPNYLDSSGTSMIRAMNVPTEFNNNTALLDPVYDTYANSFCGSISDLRIYNRVLTDDDMTKLFNSSCLLTNYYDPSGNDLINLFCPAYTNPVRNDAYYVGHRNDSGVDLGMVFSTYTSGIKQRTIPYYHNLSSYDSPNYTSYSNIFSSSEPYLPFVATGSYTITNYGNGYFMVVFTDYGTITFGTGSSSVQLLVVGGGGGGGSNGSTGYTYGGGGGQGGQSVYSATYSIKKYTTYVCEVGKGGYGGTSTASGDSGTASIFSDVIASGGTGGNNATVSAQGAGGTSTINGGSGGNGGTNNSIGSSGSNGTSITFGVSAATNYSGGGAGGRSGTYTSSDATGGSGGGGSGNSTAGTANTGGGGGGSRGSGTYAAGGRGGSGVIAIYIGTPPSLPYDMTVNAITSTSAQLNFTAPGRPASSYTVIMGSNGLQSFTFGIYDTPTPFTPQGSTALTISEYGSPRIAFYSGANNLGLYYSRITNNTTWSAFQLVSITADPSTGTTAFVSCAIASSVKRGVFVSGANGATNSIYWGDITNIMTTSSNAITIQKISDTYTNRFNSIAVSSDGSRLIVASYNDTRKILFSNWTGTTYGPLTATLESRNLAWQGVAITNDRSRIAYITDNSTYTVLWANWNGINYNDGTTITGYANNSTSGRAIQFVNGSTDALIFSSGGAGVNVQYAIWNGTNYATSIVIPSTSNNNWGLAIDASYIYTMDYNNVFYRIRTTYNYSAKTTTYTFPYNVNIASSITGLSFGAVSTVASTASPGYMAISSPGTTRISIGVSNNVPYYFRISSGSWGTRTNIGISGVPSMTVCTGVAISGDATKCLFTFGANASAMYLYYGTTSNISSGTFSVSLAQTSDTTPRGYTCCAMTSTATRIVACTNTAIYWADYNSLTSKFNVMTQTFDTGRTNLMSISITSDATAICYSTTNQSTFLYWSAWNNANNYVDGTAISSPNSGWYGSACTFLYDSSYAILMTGNTGNLTVNQAAYTYRAVGSNTFNNITALSPITATGGGKITGIACDTGGAVFFPDTNLGSIYTIQSTKTGGVSPMTYPASPPLTINGLTSGTPYTGTFSASNSLGSTTTMAVPSFTTL